MTLGSCDKSEQQCRHENDLETGAEGQSRRVISSVSRSVAASPELCAYHRYVIQQYRHQTLKHATMTRSESQTVVDRLVSTDNDIPTAPITLP